MALYQHRFSGITALATPWMFTWWAQSERTIDAAQTAATTWLTTFWATFAAQVTPTISATGVVTSQVTQATGQQQDLRAGTVALVGTAAGNTMPTDVAVAVTLRSGTINRSGRGRFYLPPPAAISSTGTGRVNAAFITAVQTALTNAWGPYNTLTDLPCVYSRKLRQVFILTQFAIGDLYDTQRGRQDRIPETKVNVTMPV